MGKRKKQMVIYHPRNTLTFSWLSTSNGVELGDVFKMVTEAPHQFIAKDMFGVHFMKTIEDLDSNILKCMEKFKSGHLNLLPRLKDIAQVRLYSSAGDMRLNYVNMEAFLIDCLQVVAGSSNNGGTRIEEPSILPDHATIKSITRRLCRSMEDALPILKCPAVTLDDFPAISDTVETLFSHPEVSLRLHCVFKLTKAEAIRDLTRNYIYFLFYYSAGLASKFVKIYKSEDTLELRLRDPKNVLFDISDDASVSSSGESSEYLTHLVRMPSINDFRVQSDGCAQQCLVYDSAVLSSEDLCRLVVGHSIVDMLPESSKSSLFHKCRLFQRAHRKFLVDFDIEKLPWTKAQAGSDNCFSFMARGSRFISIEGIQLFLEIVKGILCGNLFIFLAKNVDEIIFSIVNSLRNWNPSKPFFRDLEPCANPVAVHFVSSLQYRLCGSMPDPALVTSIQSAAFQNITFFSTFYLLHWLRIVVKMCQFNEPPYMLPGPKLPQEIMETLELISSASEAAQKRAEDATSEATKGSEDDDDAVDSKVGIKLELDRKHEVPAVLKASGKEEVDLDRVKKESGYEDDVIYARGKRDRGKIEPESSSCVDYVEPSKKRIKVEKRELSEDEEFGNCSASNSSRKKSKNHRDVDVVKVKLEPRVFETVDVSSDDDDVIISSVVSPPSIPSYLQNAYDALNKTNSTPKDIKPSVSNSSPLWVPSNEAVTRAPDYLKKAWENIKKVEEDDELE